ncbi:8056_t:CDS:2 [Funneliformis geosporum]|uniref:8056_t:CDS:1 n=1 Tax=Funneliformis geosporum TaxID=1117311 RepID=A0A9W4SK92_9GLOM|nr:8056_t:CDS:2 [Funneliformis geosporum]
MTSTICFWCLLSLKDLSFVYLSSWFSKVLGPEHDLMLGTSFFDYFHPEEQELARRDLTEFVKKKTLTCSVTRCQYNSIQSIRNKLQRSMIPSSKSFQQMTQYSPVSSTMTSPTSLQQSNDEFIIMNVGMNVVSQDIVLACFHSDEDNSRCEIDKLTSLMHKHVENGLSKVQTPPSTPFSENSFNGNNDETPNRIFQIFNRKSLEMIFTWPDPRQSFSINDSTDSTSDLYNKDDFSRLLQDVLMTKNNHARINNNGSNDPDKKTNKADAGSPNCLKLVSDKHIILLSSGTYRQVESVVISYGDIIFAYFQILPSAYSKGSLGVSSAFIKPKSKSAPCSPATTINDSNGPIKRSRSPGSLSPLSSSCISTEVHHYVQNFTYSQDDVPEFNLDHRTKKHRVAEPPSASIGSSDNDSKVHPVTVNISPSPTHSPRQLSRLLPISPSYKPPSPSYPNSPPYQVNSSSYQGKAPTYQDKTPSYQGKAPSYQGKTPSYQGKTYQPILPSQQLRHIQPCPPRITTVKDQPLQTSQQPQQYHRILPATQPPSQQQQQSYPSPTNRSAPFLYTPVLPPQQPSSESSSAANQTRRFSQFSPHQRRTSSNNKNTSGVKKCESCHTSSSPEWRRGPTGHKTLCNACGLRYSRTIARENRKREQAQRDQEQRQREQREREERARERAAAMMMQRVIEPFSQYRPAIQRQIDVPQPEDLSVSQQDHNLPRPNYFERQQSEVGASNINNSYQTDDSDDHRRSQHMTTANSYSYPKEAYFHRNQ